MYFLGVNLQIYSNSGTVNGVILDGKKVFDKIDVQPFSYWIFDILNCGRVNKNCIQLIPICNLSTL
jgi:hypothetical protein